MSRIPAPEVVLPSALYVYTTMLLWWSEKQIWWDMHTKYLKNTLKRHTLANKPHFPMKECKQITALTKKITASHLLGICVEIGIIAWYVTKQREQKIRGTLLSLHKYVHKMYTVLQTMPFILSLYLFNLFHSLLLTILTKEKKKKKRTKAV